MDAGVMSCLLTRVSRARHQRRYTAYQGARDSSLIQAAHDHAWSSADYAESCTSKIHQTKGTWLKIAGLRDLSYLNWYSSMYMNNPNASHACSLKKRKAVTQGIGQVPEGYNNH
jgi:hypothetical protein